MRNAFDVICRREVLATTCGITYTIRASSQRFICPYCHEWVALTSQGHKEQHFRHKMGNADECEARSQTSDCAYSTYYSPETSFGLPIYLIGSNFFSLKIGFLQRNTGCAVLTNTINEPNPRLNNDYPLGENTIDHYVYLGLDKKAQIYYLRFNSKTYYGEGIEEKNIFFEKTRRRLRLDGGGKESLFTNARYLLMVDKKSDFFEKNKKQLFNADWFIESNDFIFDFSTYAILSFVALKNKPELLQFLKVAFNVEISSSPVDLKFYWPLNTSYQEHKYFFYDNELYADTKNVQILKTNQGAIEWDKDKPFTYQLQKNDEIIGWNQNSGIMYQLGLKSVVSYGSFVPEVELFNPINEEKIDDYELSLYSKIDIRSNVKCKILCIGKGIRTYSLNENNPGKIARLSIDVKQDDKAFYVMFNNKTKIKLLRKNGINNLQLYPSLNYSKILRYASLDDDLVRTNKELLTLIKKVDNKQIKIIIKNAVMSGLISNSLQKYILEVLG